MEVSVEELTRFILLSLHSIITIIIKQYCKLLRSNINVYMLAIADQTAGPDGPTFFNETL